jgi:hypothetical protein
VISRAKLESEERGRHYPAPPPFVWIEAVRPRSARVVYHEHVLTLMREFFYAGQWRTGEHGRVLQRLQRADFDSMGRLYSLCITQRSSATVARFLGDAIAYEVGQLHRATQPWIEERHRQIFERALRDASAFLIRFAEGRVNAVELLSSLAPKSNR